MHNSYFYLKSIVSALDETITELILSDCFSQTKDEMFLSFRDAKSSFWIKASISPHYALLNFPSIVHRKRINSATIFGDAINKKVRYVRFFS